MIYIFFNILQAFSNIITGACDMLDPKSSHARWLDQRDITELHAGDNALTCLFQPCS